MNLNKLISLLSLVTLMLSTTIATYAQKYRIHTPPVDGYFMDTSHEHRTIVYNPNIGITVFSDSGYIYASGKGKVSAVFSADKHTHMMIMEDKNAYFWSYNNLDSLYLQKGDAVNTGQCIGRLIYDTAATSYSVTLAIFKQGKGQITHEEITGKKRIALLHAQR